MIRRIINPTGAGSDRSPQRRLHALSACAALFAVCAMLLAAAPAGAQHLLEPEIGFKSFDGRLDDEIVPGISLGGTYGRLVSETAAITLHLDIGFHDTRRHGDFVGNSRGRSFDLALGFMVSPGLRKPDRLVAPYLGLSGGMGVAGIGDGASSAVVGVEAGARFGGSASRGVSLGGRVVRHFWRASPRLDPASNEYVVALRGLFRLPA